MNDVAIRVENLGKLYHLGKRERYRTLRDTLVASIAAPFRRLRSGPSSSGGPETIWALKDVSFEVKHGEVIGIIGRNGAGKSTLLKILSRITEPTEGQATISGRVGSLLEVGTGFHPELTGRDNIFLNGAILGMKKAEIERKFDEIVAFAEVERFIDTPVKHYSSGMYVRLAFAVAAHLEPEVLIVDEVLAVGDIGFQAKCLGKMDQASKGGKTVVFVSHNMEAVQRLCRRVLVFEGGAILFDGNSREGIHEYCERAAPGASARRRVTVQDSASDRVLFSDVAMLDILGAEQAQFHTGEPFQVEVSLRCCEAIPEAVVGIEIRTATGQSILSSHSDDLTPSRHKLQRGNQMFRCLVDPNILMPGDYSVALGVVDGNWNLVSFAEDALAFKILPLKYSESTPSARRPGLVVVPYRWDQLAKEGRHVY